MFMVINKDKVVSYLISLSTVAMLFIFSFMVSKKNDEIIRTSTNAINENNCQQTNSINENNCQQTNSINENNCQQTNSINENNCQQTVAVNENNYQRTNSNVKNNANIADTDSNFD